MVTQDTIKLNSLILIDLRLRVWQSATESGTK